MMRGGISFALCLENLFDQYKHLNLVSLKLLLSASTHKARKLYIISGLIEIAGLYLDGPKMFNGWYLQDRNMTDRLLGVDFAGLELDGPTDGVEFTGLDFFF